MEQDRAVVMTAEQPPPGTAIVERIGWDEDNRFTALLVFENGGPSLPLAIVFNSIPVRLVPEATSAALNEPTRSATEMAIAVARLALARIANGDAQAMRLAKVALGDLETLVPVEAAERAMP